MILLRNQQLGDDDLLAFSRRFGELDPPPNQERGRHQPAGLSRHLCRVERARQERRPDRRARRRRGGLAHRHELPRQAARCLDALCAGDSAGRRQHLVLRHAGGVRRAAGRAAASASRGRRVKHDGTYNSGGYLRKGVTPTDDPMTAPGAWHPAILQASGQRPADALSRPAPQLLHRGPVARGVRRAARGAVGACHAAAVPLRACLAARRSGDVGQPLDHASPRSVRRRRRGASCIAPRSRAAASRSLSPPEEAHETSEEVLRLGLCRRGPVADEIKPWEAEIAERYRLPGFDVTPPPKAEEITLAQAARRRAVGAAGDGADRSPDAAGALLRQGGLRHLAHVHALGAQSARRRRLPGERAGHRARARMVRLDRRQGDPLWRRLVGGEGHRAAGLVRQGRDDLDPPHGQDPRGRR